MEQHQHPLYDALLAIKKAKADLIAEVSTFENVQIRTYNTEIKNNDIEISVEFRLNWLVDIKVLRRYSLDHANDVDQEISYKIEDGRSQWRIDFAELQEGLNKTIDILKKSKNLYSQLQEVTHGFSAHA